MGQKPGNWLKTLDQSLWACQNSLKVATNSTPFRTIFFYDAVLLVEIYLQSTRIQRQLEIPCDQYLSMMLDELVNFDEEGLVALVVLIRQKAWIAKSYNKKFKSKTFAVGDYVRKVILPINRMDKTLGKWSLNWEGPFRISQVFSFNAYEVEELGLGSQILRINGEYLKDASLCCKKFK